MSVGFVYYSGGTVLSYSFCNISSSVTMGLPFSCSIWSPYSIGTTWLLRTMLLCCCSVFISVSYLYIATGLHENLNITGTFPSSLSFFFFSFSFFVTCTPLFMVYAIRAISKAVRKVFRYTFGNIESIIAPIYAPARVVGIIMAVSP